MNIRVKYEDVHDGEEYLFCGQTYIKEGSVEPFLKPDSEVIKIVLCREDLVITNFDE